MMTVVEESDKAPVSVPQGGSKVNGPGQFDTTSSLLMQAQLVDMYLNEVNNSKTIIYGEGTEWF